MIADVDWRWTPYVHLAYALIMGAALVTCSLLLRRTQKSLPLSPVEKLGIGVGAFCGAMIGAKLPFLLSDWKGMLDGTAWLSHGKTIMCGIVGGYFGVEIAKWVLDIRVKTGDTFAAPVAVAVAIGRLACFQAGCCYGTPTTLPWGVVFSTAVDDPAIPRHPTQLYESLFHAAAAIVLVALARRGRFRAQLIKLYLLSYLAYRFVTEFIRPEAKLMLGLTGYQWTAVALVPLFVWLWYRDQRQLQSSAPASTG
ncbi:MAG: prolipoprotein diacylglyceryl transferase [Pirellulaceae bacterium]|nr:prolipoprotein diacylglyceryl transferase [Planctomycetales bacterium]